MIHQRRYRTLEVNKAGQASNAATGTSLACSLSLAQPAVGDLLVACVACDDSEGTTSISSVTDDASNAYTERSAAYGFGVIDTKIYTAPVTAVPSTVTMNLAESEDERMMFVWLVRKRNGTIGTPTGITGAYGNGYYDTNPLALAATNVPALGLIIGSVFISNSGIYDTRGPTDTTDGTWKPGTAAALWAQKVGQRAHGTAHKVVTAAGNQTWLGSVTAGAGGAQHTGCCAVVIPYTVG